MEGNGGGLIVTLSQLHAVENVCTLFLRVNTGALLLSLLLLLLTIT
jgi:hypothetical protein